jgi:hypothetical protein
VGRWGDVLLVVAEADSATTSLLLEHCRGVAEAGGDGRTLSRRLAGFLSTFEGELPAFAAAAPVPTGLAVFVQGAAQVRVGDEFTVSGAASLAWVDRLVPWPVTTVTISVGEGQWDAPRGLFNLQRGVVPGDGLTLRGVPNDAVSDPPAPVEEAEVPPTDVHASLSAAVRLADPTPEPDVALLLDRWPGEAVDAPDFESVVMDVNAPTEPDEVPREPLPVVSKGSKGTSEQPVSTGPVVKGVHCKNDHFNDPRVLFCAVCGINMVQQTPVFTEGPRPPLGVLLLDDGSAFQLDSDYVLGREPAYDDDVRTGRLRGIVVNDPDRSVSRAHARIELRQWDVVLIDNSSANGTYVAEKDENHWKPLTPGTAHPLTSGSRIRLGSRTLAFNFFRGE